MAMSQEQIGGVFVNSLRFPRTSNLTKVTSQKQTVGVWYQTPRTSVPHAKCSAPVLRSPTTASPSKGFIWHFFRVLDVVYNLSFGGTRKCGGRECVAIQHPYDPYTRAFACVLHPPLHAQPFRSCRAVSGTTPSSVDSGVAPALLSVSGMPIPLSRCHEDVVGA